MIDLARYWRTVRHLKPVQVYGRIRFRLGRPRPDIAPAPPRRVASGVWVEPARRRASVLGEEQFCFLNETRSVRPLGWNDPNADKLWTYNLHYFDDLHAINAEARGVWHRQLLSRWVRENAPGVGTGWDPYPTSLRMVNWIKWALAGNSLPAECEQSLAVQARWLSKRLETHLLGNHLFANAKALVCAGLFFEGREARAWLEKGGRILEREIPEQVLADGGHFERSTMYHALILEDMLDLTNLMAVFGDGLPVNLRRKTDDLRQCTQAMRDWLPAMCHPDGEIAFFNDAALGIAPSPAELDSYASRLGVPATAGGDARVILLSATGYIRLEGAAAVVLLDVAPVGAGYIPAHAHADTLSFELSLFGQRVFVNSGTSCYGLGAERLRQRGTAAHNTVVVDGENSSEVWGGFRVGRRATPFGLEVTGGEMPVVRCSHDGYVRLPGKPVHRREWSLAAGALMIEDHVSGEFTHAEARFHLHPSVSVVDSDMPRGSRQLALRLPDGKRVGFSAEGAVLRKVDSTWHPEFGLSVPNVCIVADLEGHRLLTRLTWVEN